MKTAVLIVIIGRKYNKEPRSNTICIRFSPILEGCSAAAWNCTRFHRIMERVNRSTYTFLKGPKLFESYRVKFQGTFGIEVF